MAERLSKGEDSKLRFQQTLWVQCKYVFVAVSCARQDEDIVPSKINSPNNAAIITLFTFSIPPATPKAMIARVTATVIISHRLFSNAETVEPIKMTKRKYGSMYALN
ncbi:hypothetical protein DW099_05415 [Emergencia timonensis]|uniref:Uncharacterized protein n=1 Tax=Emergencia timonensis TaxID=1776384 RepID=A0A415E8I5_9FIRM|nr:hypothetical protein DW099_05415 [Emergencia timonensis]